MNIKNLSLPVTISEEDIKAALKPCIEEELQKLRASSVVRSDCANARERRFLDESMT